MKTQKKKKAFQEVGFRKLVKAIRNCDEQIKDAVLEEYRKL